MFFYSSKPIKSYDGKYQKGKDIKQIMTSWKPTDMLPKAYLDFDAPQPKPLEQSWQKINTNEINYLT